MAEGCEYWTYHMPFLSCYLKTADTDKANMDGWITGNKACGTKSIKMNSNFHYHRKMIKSLYNIKKYFAITSDMLYYLLQQPRRQLKSFQYQIPKRKE